MHADDMKVESPLQLIELDERETHVGHTGENQCTYCGVGALDPWYPIEDVTVIRHWKSVSGDGPSGGHWTWYCPEHLERRAGNWWRSSHLAPAHLLPEQKHFCTRTVAMKGACGEVAIEPFDGIWLCERHADAERTNRRIVELLSESDGEDPID